MTSPTLLRAVAPVQRRVLLVVGLLALGVAVATARAVGEWRRPGPPTAVVDEIHPTATRLPANLLRLYVVFSEPMSMGESRQHLRLLDAAGRTVDRAFLELDEELWDPSGRRLTVLFDPGRIKRGLRANLEEGPPLVEGGRYTLVVDAGWRDARGRALQTGARKSFDVVAPDRALPDVDAWAIDPPPAQTRAPVVVRFDEPLDRALLSSTLTVQDPSGADVTGAIDVARGERQWTLTPERPWLPGRYVLRVATELEDVAGNNLVRLFDTDLTREHGPRGTAPSERTRTFVVSTVIES